MEILGAIAVAAAGAFLGAFAQRIASHRQEKHQATVDLFRYYHSPDMLEARRVAWVFLNASKDRPIAIQDIFDGEDRDVARTYHAVVRVIYFWFLLDVSCRQNEIAKDLAIEMFGYHARQWNDAFLPLAEASQSREAPAPEWTPMFTDRKLAWLIG